MIFLLLITCYCVGSIPFGLLLSRAAGYGDLRTIGSGNIGATNVLRTGNKRLAALTLLLDAAKGALAVTLCSFLAPSLEMTGGICALAGHIFPVWLKFRGGKGVATTIGILLALAWPVGAGVCAVWVCVFALTRISSLSALISINLSPMLALASGRDEMLWLCGVLALTLCITHRHNIQRLIHGTEPRFTR